MNEKSFGTFGFGNTNQRGQYLVIFLETNDFYAMNTFKKKTIKDVHLGPP